MNTQQRFEDRLLGELRAMVAANAEPERRPRGTRRRLALAGGVAVLLAVAAGAGVLLLSGGAQPAYAVTPNGDGTVTVTINSLRDASGLEQKLREAGVPAVVTYLPSGKACRQPWFTPAGHAGLGEMRSSSGGRPGGPTTFTVGSNLPAGDTIVITTQTGSNPAGSGPDAVGIGIAVASGDVRPCQVVDAPPGHPFGPLDVGEATHRSGG
jgi:hypothetical protein